MNYIKKRDGKLAIFNKQKIKDAVLAAFEDVDGEITEQAQEKANNIATHISKLAEDKEFSVEEVQDLVEHGLMSCKRKDVARSYITYRNERTRQRLLKDQWMQTYRAKLNGENIVNQNANLDEHSFGGRKGEANNEFLKQYALDYCMSEKSRYNHLNNRIYIHDLDSYAVGLHNCLSIPYDKLLNEGFNTRQVDIRPANSISTMMQLVAVIAQLQSLQQFGGVSATHLDWSAVPFVRKSFFKHWKDAIHYLRDGVEMAYKGEEVTLPLSQTIEADTVPSANTSIDAECYTSHPKLYKYALEMTQRETYQACEGLYHNLNSLQSRSGNQLPFTSINYGTCTLPEGRMVIKALLQVSIDGLGALHKTSVFPCGIFQCMSGVNRKPGDPNYDLFRLALESTSKRLYPNYANVDWSGNAGYNRDDPSEYLSSMGCRTINGYDINGFGYKKDGRGNICPVTIIMPTIAMEALQVFDKGNGYKDTEQGQAVLINYFLRCLDKAIYEAKDMLLERFEYICNQPMESAKFMYENGTMTGYVPEEGICSALKHGTLAVG